MHVLEVVLGKFMALHVDQTSVVWKLQQLSHSRPAAIWAGCLPSESTTKLQDRNTARTAQLASRQL